MFEFVFTYLEKLDSNLKWPILKYVSILSSNLCEFVHSPNIVNCQLKDTNYSDEQNIEGLFIPVLALASSYFFSVAYRHMKIVINTLEHFSKAEEREKLAIKHHKPGKKTKIIYKLTVLGIIHENIEV